jgi:ribosomal protein L37AE/L43A
LSATHALRIISKIHLHKIKIEFCGTLRRFRKIEIVVEVFFGLWVCAVCGYSWAALGSAGRTSGSWATFKLLGNVCVSFLNRFFASAHMNQCLQTLYKKFKTWGGEFL